MKKFAVSLVALLAVVIMAFSFTACNASGTYKFNSMTVTTALGQETTYKVGDKFKVGNEEVKITKDWYTLDLNKDGTCSIVVQGESAKSGTWEENDGEITFSVAGIPFNKATKDGNKITFTYDLLLVKYEITLKK